MHLPALQTANKFFTVLELDYSPKLADWLGLDLTASANLAVLEQVNQQLWQELAQADTITVLDPVYTFKLLKTQSSLSALALRLSQLTPAVDPLAVPRLIPNWGVEEVANNQALAKLELYYHPAEEQALAKKQLVAELADYCQYLQIPLLLKLVIYTPAEEEFELTKFQANQLEAVQEFRQLAQFLALQYPQEALACATLTAELDIPWLLNTDGIDYQGGKEMLRVALDNGAQGMMMGELLWQDLAEFKQKDQSPDLTAIQDFIKTTVRDRVLELTRIVKEQQPEST
ncbi:MAG: hypothetical protein GF390_01710 [Candidatus Pacebacteria bacterium]|nr:hypothetical protein [Candidatus Paceibacterota bacterium]